MKDQHAVVPAGNTQAILDEVEQLVRAGEHRAAITLLECAGEAGADAAIAQRLVDLRVEAFPALERSSGAPLWPPVHDSRYEAHNEFPVIHASELDANALKAGVFGKGCLIVRGLMDAARVDTMRAAIDNALRARRLVVTGEPEPDSAAWFNRSPRVRGGPAQLDKTDSNRYSESGSLWAVDSPCAALALTRFYRELGLPAMLEEYFEEAAVLSVRKWVLRCITPNNGGQAGWHQDGRFLGDPDIRTLNLWLALTDCGGDAAAPGIELVGGNDGTLYETGTAGADFDWTVSQRVVDDLLQTHPVEVPAFRAGDAVFFDHFNLHRTAFGTAHTDNRYAVESWFFAASTAPAKQQPLVF